MKRLKSIAILALSAAIFSFAACDFDDGWGNSGDSGSSSKTTKFVLSFNEDEMTVNSYMFSENYKNGDTTDCSYGLQLSPKNVQTGKQVQTWKLGPKTKETTLGSYECTFSEVGFSDSELATLTKNDDGNYILPISYELRDSYTVTLNFDQDNAWCSNWNTKEIKPGVLSEDTLQSLDTTFKFNINYNAYEKQWTSEDGTKPYVYGYSIDGGKNVISLLKNGYISSGTNSFSVDFNFMENAGKSIDFKFMTRPAKSFEITFPETLSITRSCYATYTDSAHLESGNLKGYKQNSDYDLVGYGKKETITSGTKIYEGESIYITTFDSTKTFVAENCTINGIDLENTYKNIILYSPDGTNYELWTSTKSLGISVTDGIVIEYEQ